MDRNDIAILLAHRYSIPISDTERTVLAGLMNRKEYNKEDTIIPAKLGQFPPIPANALKYAVFL